MTRGGQGRRDVNQLAGPELTPVLAGARQSRDDGHDVDPALAFHEALLELAPRRISAWRHAPALMRRALPDPLRSDAELRRFVHDDIATMSPQRASSEALQLRVAMALVADVAELDDAVPLWIHARLRKLEQRRRAAA